MQQELQKIIINALREDIGDGDHSTLACVEPTAIGKAQLLAKENGILAGVDVAKAIYEIYDPQLQVNYFMKDGDLIQPGDIILTVEGSSQSILSTERLVLNFMQRMSGIATQTRKLVDLIEGTNTKLLDTRKTTPGVRLLEKWAVKIGGGHNHRIGLYDMIMLKDNHIDYAGGIREAMRKTLQYLNDNQKDLKIEVEVRDFNELQEALEVGGFHRIMLDNFTPSELSEALKLIDNKFETEASGGITPQTIRSYAETGVDYISVGMLTHAIKSLDLSLKAVPLN
jgi:nicotinate-nucleotide pyrophosphorylase (carboxylating)